jgi:hypothetical protein
MPLKDGQTPGGFSQSLCVNYFQFGERVAEYDSSSLFGYPPDIAETGTCDSVDQNYHQAIFVSLFIGSGGRYGHMGVYDYKFLVQSVERAEVILNNSPIPAALPAKVLQRTRCHGASRQRLMGQK